MAKKKKSAVRLGIYVTDRYDGDYYHIVASVVTIGRNGRELAALDRGDTLENIPYTRIRNTSNDDTRPLYFEGLHVQAQGDRQKGGDARGLYGFDIEYRQLFSVDLRNAPYIAKTLKTIDTRMDKLANKFGRPVTFGQYLANFAHVIGADAFVFLKDPKNRSSHYDANEHRIEDIRSGVCYVDNMQRLWEEKNRVEVHAGH